VYEAYWGLSEPSFDNAPNPKFLYRSPEHEEALTRLMYAVRQRKGCGMLTGEYGCGKTMLSRALIHRLVAERYEIALLTNPGATPIDFLREVLYQLGVTPQDTGRSELLHQLADVCVRNFGGGRDTVIIVDEAQLIEGDAVFEELRLLMNLQTDERFLVTLVLIGSPELVTKVRRLKPLDQRIAIRYHLNTLDATHTAGYIAHRLAMAGRPDPIFTDEAIKLIFDFSRGTPREINSVCDLALLIGYSRRARDIDEKMVGEVIRDIVGIG
jgi:general secretion pathway protein A